MIGVVRNDKLKHIGHLNHIGHLASNPSPNSSLQKAADLLSFRRDLARFGNTLALEEGSPNEEVVALLVTYWRHRSSCSAGAGADWRWKSDPGYHRRRRLNFPSPDGSWDCHVMTTPALSGAIAGLL